MFLSVFPNKGLRFFAYILIVGAATSAIVFSYKNAPPHEFNFMEGECKTCHINYQPPFSFKKNITELCNSCHGRDEAVSHIVGVSPSMKTGAEYPLDEHGEMTCNTCHNIHMEALNPATGKRTYLLRADSRGRPFCDSCHVDTVKALMSGMLSEAHIGYDATRSGREDVDNVSYRCLTCHSGDIAGKAPVTFETGNPVEGSHPIGIGYRGPDLRDAGTLPPGIKLIEGKVGCASCHDPYSVRGHKLAISNSTSGLCLTCHMK